MDKEILDGFQVESKLLLKELIKILDQLESWEGAFPTSQLEGFSQVIDRIMGAAQTLAMEAPNHAGLKRISRIAELCKRLGYAAAQRRATEFIPIFAAFWADTVDVLGDLIDVIDDEVASTRIAKEFSQVVQGRLEWLSQKVMAGAPEAGKAAQGFDLKDLLKDF